MNLWAYLCFLSTLWISLSAEDDYDVDLCYLTITPMFCQCANEDAVENEHIKCFLSSTLQPNDPVFKGFAKQKKLQAVVLIPGPQQSITSVPVGIMKYTQHVKNLKIEYATLSTIHPFTFSNMTELNTLSLERNDIEELGKFAISNLPKLHKLELGSNRISLLPSEALYNLPNLTHLYLDRNNMSVIENFAFAQLKSLIELELTNNAIESLTENTFSGLNSLRRLDLFRNRLRRLEARVFSDLTALQELDVKYNVITDVDPLAFEGLKHLTTLRLSHNRLKVLPPYVFKGAPELMNVELSNNELTTLSLKSIQYLRRLKEETFYLSLLGNRFVCDCRLAWILHLSNETKNMQFRRDLRHASCEFYRDDTVGNHTRRNKVVKLSESDLGCPTDYTKPTFPVTAKPTYRPLDDSHHGDVTTNTTASATTSTTPKSVSEYVTKDSEDAAVPSQRVVETADEKPRERKRKNASSSLTPAGVTLTALWVTLAFVLL